MQNNKPKLIRIFIIVAVISVIVAAILVSLIRNSPNLYGRITAPRFATMRYESTRYIPPSMCFFLCEYIPEYHYKASGSQQTIANEIIETMKKKGYVFQNTVSDRPSEQARISCYGGGKNSSGDEYTFEKHDNKTTEPYPAIVTFWPQSELQEINSIKVGCERPNATYEVNIVFYDRTVTGF